VATRRGQEPMKVKYICTLVGAAALMLASQVQADVSRFVGNYTGEAGIISSDGTVRPRDMSVEITETKQGFRVTWTSITYRADGTSKTKTYTIDFQPSQREGIYAAAQERNVFGHEVQLDPMKGEPYVWGRIIDDTLSVFSMFVSDDGGYEIQQFDRTLADGGLELDYQAVVNGMVQRSVSTFLTKD